MLSLIAFPDGAFPDAGVSLVSGPVSTMRIVDADCHILEPPDIWTNWLPEKYQDRAPQLVKDPKGGDAWRTAVEPMSPIVAVA